MSLGPLKDSAQLILMATSQSFTTVKDPSRREALEELAVKALSQQVHRMSAESLSKLVLIQLPLAHETKYLGALQELVHDTIPERDFKLYKGHETVQLIDVAVMSQWRKTYPCLFEESGRYRQDNKIPFNEFVWVVSGEADRIEVSETNFHDLFAMAVQEEGAPLQRLLSDYVLSEIETRAERGREIQDSLSEKGIKLGQISENFLQDLWERFERSIKNDESGSLLRSKKFSDILSQAILKIFSELEARPLTVHYCDHHLIQRTLDSLEAQGKLQSIGFHLPSTRPSLPLVLPKSKGLPSAISYRSECTNTEMHKNYLHQLPFIRSVGMRVDSKSKADEFAQALSELTFVESFELEVQGKVEEGLLEIFFKHLQRWPITEISLTSSPEHAEEMKALIAEGLAGLEYLKDLHLKGITI
jgi:hypothetical protein